MEIDVPFGGSGPRETGREASETNPDPLSYLRPANGGDELDPYPDRDALEPVEPESGEGDIDDRPPDDPTRE